MAAFEWLIRACRPVTVMGEQVASKDGLAWLDIVHADLEGQGYTFGALDLCSAGFGAPHIRQRLWFRGDTNIIGRPTEFTERSSEGEIEAPGRTGVPTSSDSKHSVQRGGFHMGGKEEGSEIETPERQWIRVEPGACCRSLPTSTDTECIRSGRGSDGLTGGFWAGCEWQFCRDGKYRPWEGDAERSVFAVADGLPADLVHSSETRYPLIAKGQEGRTMRLRGYGNAINPWVAAEFILATEGTEEAEEVAETMQSLPGGLAALPWGTQ